MNPIRRASAILAVLALAASFALAAPVKPRATAAAPRSAGAPAKAPAKASARAADSDRLDAIAALVNDEAVLASDVEEELMQFLQSQNAQPDSAQLDTLRHQILDQLIDNKLVLLEAKKQAVVVTDAEVNREVDRSIEEVKQRLGGDEAFAAQLKKENTSLAALRAKYANELRDKLIGRKLVSKALPQKPVAQPEAEKYFNEHPDKFPKVPGELRLSVIQIPPTPDSVAMAAGRQRALETRKRLTGGERFAKVAAEVSDDGGSAKSGGDLGFFPMGAMTPAFEKVTFSQPLNTVSEPVQTPFGWHLIETLERDTLKTEAHKDSLDAKGKPILEAHARHILIAVQPNNADIERAQALAERVREQARKGTDFATLARRYSHYEGASPEGDVGFVSLGSLQPAIRAGLDSLEVGEVSQVLPNNAGFNVFKVTDRHPERAYTLDEVRKELPDAVAQIQFRERYDAWMKSLRAKANIEYHDR